MEDEDMQYCKICLVTDCKMFSSPSISEAYSQLVQVVFCADYKLFVCYECKHVLRKCQEFRFKCMTALNVLSSVHIDHSKIPTRFVRGIDRKHFKLESKISRSSMLLVCNNNQRILIPEIKDSDIGIDNNPDALEDDKSETKFAIYAEGKDPFSDSDIKIEIETNPDTLEDDKPEKKFNIDAVFFDVETNDTYYPNEIIQSSHAPNNMVPEIKSEQKCQMKSKKTVPTKIKTFKRFTTYRNIFLSPLSASSILSRAPNKDMMKMLEEYAIVDVMTLSQAKKEMLLKKESSNYKNNVYTCELCCKGFTVESTFKNHMKHHSPDSGTQECEICHLLFPKRGQLAHHIERCHKYRISCKLCSYVCSSPNQAKSHFSAIHKGETYTCDMCNMHFRYSHSLINHKRLKHPEHVCADCGNMFASLLGLRVHKNRAHKQDSTELLGPKCEECDIKFATETAWKRHLVFSSKHTVSNGCEECGEAFLTADELKIHEMDHPQMLAKAEYFYSRRRSGRPGVCKLCDIQMDTYFEYMKHMKSAHPNTTAGKIVRRQVGADDTQYICEVCGKGFKSCILLKYHRNKHTGELPYECDQCDKKYTQPGPLHQHKACRHSGAPQFQCDVCQKGFHLKSALRNHMITVHLGVRRFKCNICNKLFRHPCEVKNHMEYVHFKKPWPKRDRTKRRNKED